MNLDNNVNKELLMAFGRTLKRLRKEQSISQLDLVDSSGVSLRMISDMERGIRQPSLTTLFKLASGLKISASSLVKVLEKEYKLS